MGKKIHSTIFAIFIALVVLSGCTQNTGDDKNNQTTPSPTIDKDEFIYGDAVVEDIQIMVLESFPVQIRVIARGYLPDGCTKIDQIVQKREGNTFSVTITTKRSADAMCTQALVPFEETISLDVHGLEAGVYEVNVNGISSSFTLTADNIIPTG